MSSGEKLATNFTNYTKRTAFLHGFCTRSLALIVYTVP